MKYLFENPESYPYDPDIKQRETIDNGFSKGWGSHFQTSEKYWIDCHVHSSKSQVLKECLQDWFEWSLAYRQAKLIILDGHPKSSDGGIHYEELSRLAKEDKNIEFLYYPGIDDTDKEPLERALELGAKGLKLWSPELIIKGRPYDEFEYPKWEGVFEIVNDRQLPIVWHVTQRLTGSPYTGGGVNAYWSEGWKKGVKYTNEDLLQSFLRIARAYPKGHFIGAHQLHVGWERLEQIFDEYPNVYIDTSIGCFVRWGDIMYPEDQKKLRNFFIKYADRILFGTDIGIGKGRNIESEHLSLMGHILFIRQLQLPYDELQKISHENAERLFRIEKSSDVRIANIRP